MTLTPEQQKRQQQLIDCGILAKPMTPDERHQYLIDNGIIDAPKLPASPQKAARERHRQLVEAGVIAADAVPGFTVGETIQQSRRDLSHPAMVAYRNFTGITEAEHRARMGSRTSSEVRSTGPGAGAVTLRVAPTGGNTSTIYGHASRFAEWTTISSAAEGRFLERVSAGAFADSIRADKRGSIKLLFSHGQDAQIGNKPLGALDVLREDGEGLYYESQLFDTSYNKDLIPGLRAGVYGASFRFSVPEGGDEWVMPKSGSDYNPTRLPERTLNRVTLVEVSPCTWGAYPGATAGIA
jgi:HK97 family phage prohead protease